MYNKHKYQKFNDKKVLHKIRKQWVTVSLALFMMIGGGAVVSHVSASANNINNQNVTSGQSNKSTNNTITDRATQLHHHLINNASVHNLRLGSSHGRRGYVLRNRFRRSNNGRVLNRSGYFNATKYRGNFIFSKYAPNDKRAVVPKRLNLKHLNWAKGRFGQLNLTLFTHKRYGWNKLSNRNVRKYRNTLNRIYRNYKNSRRRNARNYKRSRRVNNRKSHRSNRYNHQLKRYEYLMKHGSRRSRKANRRAYYRLRNYIKHMNTKRLSRHYRRGRKSITPEKSVTRPQTQPNSDTVEQNTPSKPSSDQSSVSDQNEKPDSTHKYLTNTNDSDDPSMIMFSTKQLNDYANHFSDMKNQSDSDYTNYYQLSSDYSLSSDQIHRNDLVHVINTANVAGQGFSQIKNASGNDSDNVLNNSWVFDSELSNTKNSHLDPSTVMNDFKHRLYSQEIQERYTPDEIAQLQNIKNQYNYLENNENNKDVNNLSGYRQEVVDWVNYYRNIEGLSNVTENPSYDQYAQSHAEQNSDPEDMIVGNPNDPASDSPDPSETEIYFTDANDADNNGSDGHRDSILNPSATNVGVGRQGSVSTLFFNWGENGSNADVHVNYPCAGLFPFSEANQGNEDYWEFNTSTNLDSPTVAVFDNTANVQIKTNSVNNEGHRFYYSVDSNALKPNHQYTITINDASLPGGSYSYTTKLFQF